MAGTKIKRDVPQMSKTQQSWVRGHGKKSESSFKPSQSKLGSNTTQKQAYPGYSQEDFSTKGNDELRKVKFMQSTVVDVPHNLEVL
jgi:hypothetical protein